MFFICLYVVCCVFFVFRVSFLLLLPWRNKIYILTRMQKSVFLELCTVNTADQRKTTSNALIFSLDPTGRHDIGPTAVTVCLGELSLN